MSNTSYNPLTIRFIRSNDISSKDDVITVKPHWRDLDNGISILEYNVTSRVANYESGSTKNFSQEMFSHDLITYLDSMFKLYLYDTAPYESVQIDFPNAPSILLTLKELKKNSQPILSLIRTSFNSWPKVVDPVVKSRRHVFFDDEGLPVN